MHRPYRRETVRLRLLGGGLLIAVAIVGVLAWPAATDGDDESNRAAPKVMPMQDVNAIDPRADPLRANGGVIATSSYDSPKPSRRRRVLAASSIARQRSREISVADHRRRDAAGTGHQLGSYDGFREQRAGKLKEPCRSAFRPTSSAVAASASRRARAARRSSPTEAVGQSLFRAFSRADGARLRGTSAASRCSPSRTAGHRGGRRRGRRPRAR